MADNTVWAYGTTIGYSAIDAGSYTTVLAVDEIDEQKLKRKKIDITHLASPDNTMEYRAGMVEPEAFKIKVQYQAAQHAVLYAMSISATPNRDWKVTFSDATTGTFRGYLSTFPPIPKAKVDDVYEADIEIQPTGKVTYA